MSSYAAPTRDTLFILQHVLDITNSGDLPGIEMLDADTVSAMVEEAGKFCAEVIAPLNASGDAQGCTHHQDGSVTTPDGFKDAYRQFQESGWGTLALPEQYGGQGLPHILHSVFEEYLAAANHAFMMYPGLTHGAVSALMSHGSEQLQADWLPNLVSGQWLGTMALTEPHCGTDLGLLRTKAEKQADGSYSITGTKIFHSGGEQDLTENIIHLVLARVADAPEGSKGLSLFLVPKFLLQPDGTLGQRNKAFCGSIEEKMGIHGNATCVTNFDGATGWIVGQENMGLAAMFVMMNAARLSVGTQGLGLAERAYQNAAHYALDRKQGRAPGAKADPAAQADPLIVHPDVRRMLMNARSFTEGMRALILWGSVLVDQAHHAQNDDDKAQADALVSFLTPVIKGFGSDRGFETAVEMQQIFGGHGYTTDYGMEQIVRDARVPMIYEGANGVQALDLVGRKLMRDGGAVASQFFAMIAQECDAADDALDNIADPLAKAVHHGEAAAKWLLENGGDNPDNLGAGSYAFMQLIGTLALGLMWLRMAKAATHALSQKRQDEEFYKAKLVTAAYYAQQFLPLATTYRHRVKAGASAMMELPAQAFAPAQ